MDLIKRVVSPLISSILGLLLLKFFNIFDYVNIAPTDLKNELALSSYILIFQIILQYISECFSNRLYTKIILECCFENNIVNNPVYVLPANDISVTQVVFKLKIDGPIKLLKDNSIYIIFPNWVHIQVLQGKSNAKYIDNKLIISFDSIIPYDRKNNIAYEEQIKIGIIRNNIDEKTSIDIVPALSQRQHNFLLKFKPYKFILKGE